MGGVWGFHANIDEYTMDDVMGIKKNKNTQKEWKGEELKFTHSKRQEKLNGRGEDRSRCESEKDKLCLVKRNRGDNTSDLRKKISEGVCVFENRPVIQHSTFTFPTPTFELSHR